MSVVVRDVVCEMCSTKFRREGDKKRHKCVTERRKPVWEQHGAVQCERCHKWFRSRGGMAVQGLCLCTEHRMPSDGVTSGLYPCRRFALPQGSTYHHAQRVRRRKSKTSVCVCVCGFLLISLYIHHSWPTTVA